ncbi:cell growth-regulating nucleolar protein-like isoform X2 [Amphiura filiformis]|uniref:cell growth-regulating nucleolar protein-like isoform X2 n=1 Tax=Amphiura filiformis TaxID=82378 RepID=UPI003B221B52
MVFFTCNACGTSVKKAQVEKHYMTQCRNCEVLSCLDCGKDFIGDAYKEHTKCVSENEKYGGKNYKAPANNNKGEAKQEQWLQRVREAKESAKLSPGVAKLLDRIADYPNVPRKKAKFENFVYNSLRVSNKGLVEEVWKVFSEASKPNNNQAKPANNNSASENSSTNNNQSQDSKTSQPTDSQSDPSEAADQSQGSKKKKKKKKDKDVSEAMATDEGGSNSKRKKHQGDPEGTLSDEDATDSRTEQENTVVKKHKKKKSKDKRTEDNGVNLEDSESKNKKKHEQIAEEQVEESVVHVNGKSKKKKHKKHQEEAGNVPSGKRKRDADAEDFEEDCTTQKIQRLDDSVVSENGDVETSKPKKFKWDRVIISVLQNYPDHQLSLKKLRKKVLNEYHACGGDVRIKSIEELRATFEKKVNKNPNFKVHKETVKLIS